MKDIWNYFGAINEMTMFVALSLNNSDPLKLLDSINCSSKCGDELDSGQADAFISSDGVDGGVWLGCGWVVAAIMSWAGI